MRELFPTDTKPRDYNYVTSRIIASTSHEEKLGLLKCLERLIIKNLTRKPTEEQRVALNAVSTFEGKNFRSVIMVWFSFINPRKKLAAQLLKLNKYKFN